MLINFNQIPETVIPNMRGGEGQVVSPCPPGRSTTAPRAANTASSTTATAA